MAKAKTAPAKSRDKLVGGPGAINVPAAFRPIGTTLTPWAMHYQYGMFAGPDRRYIQQYEVAFRTDPIINYAINFVTRSMISSIGNYVHTDQRAVAYVNEMMNKMEGSFHGHLADLITSSLWSGIGISEKVFSHEGGKVWLKTLRSYHPRSMFIVPNDKGELTDNEKLTFHPQFTHSGVWQELPWRYVTSKSMTAGMKKLMYNNYIRIPTEKLVVMNHNNRHGNFDGESALAPVWTRYQMALETWQNLIITTERYGSPQLAAIVPHGLTSQQVDLGNGQYRYKTVAEAAADVLANLSSSSAVVFEEPINISNSERIRLQNVSTFNNFGESFLATIRYLYSDVLIGMGIPPSLILEQKGSLGSGTVATVHAETFKQLMTALYKEFLEPFCEQVIGQLLKWNFGIDDPGMFVFTPFDITSAFTVMQTLDMANKNGVLDMSEVEDLQFIRATLGFPAASQDTISRRIKNNKQLMEYIRVPDSAKLDIQDSKSKTTLEVAGINTDTSKHNVKHQAKTQKEIAEMNNDSKHQVEKEKTKQAAMTHEQVMSGKAAHLERAKAAGAAVKADAQAQQAKRSASKPKKPAA